MPKDTAVNFFYPEVNEKEKHFQYKLLSGLKASRFTNN